MLHYTLVHASACPESLERCVLLDLDEHGGGKLSGLVEGIGLIATSALAMRRSSLWKSVGVVPPVSL